MTTNHAAPWTFRQFVADVFARPIKRQAPAVMSGREAVARALFYESVQGSKLDMLDYDHSPMLRGGWLAEADRRITRPVFTERYIAALNGKTEAEWAALPELARKDARENVAWKVVGA